MRWKRAFDRRGRGRIPAPSTAAYALPTATRPLAVEVDEAPEESLAAGAEIEADIEIRVKQPVGAVGTELGIAGATGPLPAQAGAASPDIVAAEEPAGGEQAGEEAGPELSSLMRRLQRARRPVKFNRHDYAAYYEPVEEASVSIVRPGEPLPTEPKAVRPAPRPVKPARVKRLFKALTRRDE